jgi:hypothetical protein
MLVSESFCKWNFSISSAQNGGIIGPVINIGPQFCITIVALLNLMGSGFNFGKKDVITFLNCMNVNE